MSIHIITVVVQHGCYMWERRILVLHSYDPEYIYTRIFNDTLERELQEKDYSIDLFYEDQVQFFV